MPQPPEPHPGWSALITSAAATTAYGLLTAYGAGLRGADLGLVPGPFWDLAWMFTALAWVSTTTVASVMVWIFAGLTALVLATAGLTNGFRSRTDLTGPVAKAATALSAVPLALVVLPFVLAAALWLVFWVMTSFGTCVQPECSAVPAVP
jgi:hypothetical protein